MLHCQNGYCISFKFGSGSVSLAQVLWLAVGLLLVYAAAFAILIRPRGEPAKAYPRFVACPVGVRVVKLQANAYRTVDPKSRLYSSCVIPGSDTTVLKSSLFGGTGVPLPCLALEKP
jgi:hypothetical protein